MIYFIQPTGEPFVKIGYSKSKVSERLKCLQTANHRKLILLASAHGTVAQERGLHFQLRAHRLHGEWFHLTQEVQALADTVKKARRYGGPTVHELKRAHRVKTPEQIAEANKRRGPRKRTKKDRRMPWDQAEPHYRNPAMTNAQVEAAVAKGFSQMSYATLRRHFGKRGTPTGRPSNKQSL